MRSAFLLELSLQRARADAHPSRDGFESETEFFFKVVDAQVAFFKDEKGQVTHLVIKQRGRSLEAKKVE